MGKAAAPAPFTIVVCFEPAPGRRFLMAHHRRRGWELPGGRLEPGEEPVAGAVREFEEETGHRLLDARLVLEQERGEHGTAFVVSGTWGSQVPGHSKHEGEPIRDVRFVARVGDVSPLAFPDDPYEEIGKAVGREIR